MSFCGTFQEAIESSGSGDRCDRPVIDAHLHVVDFLQESDGLARLLDRMDAANVSKAVVFGLPVVKKWDSCEPDRPHYYLDDDARCYYFTSTDQLLEREFESLSPEGCERLAPMLCGFNPTDRNAVFQVENHLAGGFWKGIGEILCRHDDLTSQTLEETSRMDHPALMPVYDLAGARGLPMLLHQNSTSVGIHDRFEYLDEVKRPLSEFPGTTFVWAHCGISRRVAHKLYHRMVEEMLQEHDNLFVDISWVVYDQTVCSRRVPKKAWLDLIERYPDRFMAGSDLCGHFDPLGRTMARYDALLGSLSDGARHLVSCGNASRIWKL
jgi:predicted TIM-barrel fold metal-dependent hydrolase